jgi:3-oxoacyl-[acyl-carrier-protein] synthase-3
MYAGICAVAERAGWKLEDVDMVIAHQANIRILEMLGRKLPCKHVYNNIREYGNMSGATCAVAAAEAQERGMLKEGSKLILSSYGSGTITSTVAAQF